MDGVTRHKYEYAVDMKSNSAAARVVRLVGQGKRVLDIGAGCGSITRVLSGSYDCRVTALEKDPVSANILNSFCDRVYQIDLNDVAWPQVLQDEHKYDVVVAADVLEHLYDPWSTLKSMKQFIGDDGYIVLSLPHAGHVSFLACLLDEDFEYHESGLLDRTHIRFFCMRNIQTLIEGAGLKIVDAQFVVVLPEDTELRLQWYRIAPKVRQALVTNRFGFVYQVVAKIVPSEFEGQGISLLSLPVDVPHSGILSRWFKRSRIRVAQLRARLGFGAPTRLKHLAKRLGIPAW